MNFTLISAAVAGAIGFGAAWQIQNGRMEHAENNRLTQQAEAERELYAMEQKRRNGVIDAQNAARLRERKLQADAAAAVAAADSLRDALTRSAQAARDDPGSCPDRTATASELLVECSQEYTTLAGRCSRHVSDIETLIGAWPK